MSWILGLLKEFWGIYGIINRVLGYFMGISRFFRGVFGEREGLRKSVFGEKFLKNWGSF